MKCNESLLACASRGQGIVGKGTEHPQEITSTPRILQRPLLQGIQTEALLLRAGHSERGGADCSYSGSGPWDVVYRQTLADIKLFKN